MSITLTQLSCPNCGGPIQFVPGMPVANCPYCETKIALETQNAQGASVQVEPHQVRPFRVDQANFERGLLSWLADGDYTPDDILSGVMVSEHTGLYVPFFRFTGEYRATFTASAGYERQETYVAYRKDSNGNRVPVTKTRTVTDWRPASGEASREFTVWSTASQKLPEERMEWCEETVGSQDDQWEVLSEEVIKGYAMEPFDQTADEVYAKRGKSSLSGQVRQVCRNMVQGDKCKDLRTEFSIRERDESHHYAPFWIASLKYKGETFTYVRSGSGGHLSDGSRPVDEERKKAVEEQMKPVWIVGIVTAIATIVGILLGGVPGIIAGAIGIPLTMFMYFRAKKNQKAILAKSRAVRQKLLEKVQQSGGMRADGGLSLSEADVARAHEEVAAETEEGSEDDTQA